MKMRLVLVVLAGAIGCSDNGSDSGRLGARVRTSATLRTYASCSDLLDSLRQHYSEELRAQLLATGERYPLIDVAFEADMATASAPTNEATGSTRQEGVDFSGTNNQESGVDEPDFVKTDGYYLYVLSGQTLEILSIPEIGDLVSLARVNLEGWPSEMLLDGNRVVVVSSVYTSLLDANDELAAWSRRQTPADNASYMRVGTLVKLTLIDASDHATPQVTRELYLEGNYQTGRQIAGATRLVTHAEISIPGVATWVDLPDYYWEAPVDSIERESILAATINRVMLANEKLIANASLESFLPAMVMRDQGADLVELALLEQDCSNFSIADDGTSRGITSILSLDLASTEVVVGSSHLVSNSGVIYASQDNLVIAEPAQNAWWYWNNNQYNEATNLHRFQLASDGTTLYTGSGRVDGLVDNQFGLSAYEGNIRVAATTGQWWRWWVNSPPAPESHVYVLAGDEQLDTVGQLDGIAVGERLWSVRFSGDQAFLVTYRNIDPLWTIDLSQPQQPRIAGELQVPGVSTYIHPIGQHLLTIGYGSDDGQQLDWSTQVSLFDVSDFATPVLDDALSLAPPPAAEGWVGSYSEAIYQHKAFQYWAPLGLLAIPQSTYRYFLNTCGDNCAAASYYDFEYRSALEVLSIDTSAGSVSSYGSIDHSSFYNRENNHTWWSNPNIRRSVFMHDDTRGDFLYAIGDRGITVHQITAGLPELHRAELAGTTDYYGETVGIAAAGE